MTATPPAASIRNGAARDRGLDALRGIALISVCAFHSDLLPGGWLGVDLFFVISGLWITRKLTSSEQHWRVFAARRAWRLAPALTVFLTAWTLTVLAWPSSTLSGAWTTTWNVNPVNPVNPLEIPPVVAAGVTNWWVIAGAPWPDALGHLWSLAVEWQFYLVAPVLVWLLLRASTLRARVTMLTAVAIACVVINTAVTLPLAGSYVAYLSTVGRVPALLTGVVVAFILTTRQPDTPLPAPRPLPTWVIATAIAGIVLITATPQDTIGIAIGIPAAAVISGILVWTIATHHAPQRTRRLMSGLAWLGRRCYAAYLWNLPLVFVTEAFLTDWSVPARAAVAFTATVLTAAVSWQVIEKPALTWARRREG